MSFQKMRLFRVHSGRCPSPVALVPLPPPGMAAFLCSPWDQDPLPHARAHSLPGPFLKGLWISWRGHLAQLLWYLTLKSTDQAMWMWILPRPVCSSRDRLSLMVLVPSHALTASRAMCNTPGIAQQKHSLRAFQAR